MMEKYLTAAQIVITREQDGEEMKRTDYDSEYEAQCRFDELISAAKGANEDEGYLRWDLVVHHREEGKLIRRTMFTAE